MDRSRVPEAARPPIPVETAAPARAPEAATPALAAHGIPAAALGPVALLALQRAAGNRATSAMLQPRHRVQAARPLGSARPVVQREGGAAGPSVKHTYTLPDKELGKKDLGYVEATMSVSGSADFEVTPPPAPAPESGGGQPAASGEAGGGPTPLASPGSGEVKGSGGVNVSGSEAKYQAEVGVEFEKRAVGLFEGSTPKAKIGGEASADKGKLGLEVSMEGEKLEPKFAFNLAELDAQKGIHFATLEVGVDWKIHEWSFVASDGATIKVTPKATLKVAIEPNYERILMYLVEEGGAAVAAEALVAGGLILGGAATIIGTLATLGDGEAEAKAVDNAERARRQVVAGFVAGATGADITLSDDFTMEGHNRGRQWRLDLQAGQTKSGIPVPPNVIDTKSRENEAQIRASATATANQLMHEALVRRYWEIHWAQREIPWADIDTVFMMLMEGQGFGRPGPKEGKNVGGASVLPE